ncbi:MAG: tRNA (adenosine(37)-N6)-threonylcarbamoyltransferase complex dimerization subunit type 1 TsaB [Oscillospiraceae bacterium]|nr:tRNA (adenosine(37)-N6)-threonylcarbamoyltransferase complex dimerization subunit type 1 TsaB [Oscillospiraceae bacterium]
MIILGLDSSAVTASCAVCDNDKILAYASVNVPVTHSQTLLPLTESVLKSANLSLNDIDAFAVSNGPGSFTGLRISVSAIKGMAFALSKPVCGVSTLLSLAYNLIGQNVITCCVMDARRNEVYNALFDITADTVTRLTPDRAISLDELGVELSQLTEKEIVFVGDGAELSYNYFEGTCSIAPEITRYQNAASVCLAADEFISAEKLMPMYIRKPQAEREREKL